MASTSEARAPLGKVLITGGCGFLGHHIVSQLQRSHPTAQIQVLDLSTTRNRLPNVDYHSGDICDAPFVRTLLQDLRPQVIIHTASPALASKEGGGSAAERKRREGMYKVNVEGTKILADEARDAGVKAFVYTSSASVVHDTRSDLINADERYPRCTGTKQREYYSETKALAESYVLSSNRPTTHPSFLTLALRPSGIFGPGDVQLIPPMLAALRAGQSKYQLGDNDNLFDFTYVENVAHAHILAAYALLQTLQMFGDRQPLDNEKVDGEAFFVTNDSPVYFWDYARALWTMAGSLSAYPSSLSSSSRSVDTTTSTAASVTPRTDYRKDTWTIPRDLGLFIGGILEYAMWALGRTPTLTTQKVRYSCMTRYYSCEKAKRRLGYEPLVELDEGLRRTVEWFAEREREEGEKSGRRDR